MSSINRSRQGVVQNSVSLPAIAAQNTFTSALIVGAGEIVSISITGTAFTGTVVVQRSFDLGVTWADVQNPDGTTGWTSKDYQTTYIADEACYLRIGVKTGGFAGTSVAVRLGKGGKN